MEDSLSTNNLVRVVVAVLLAVILVGVVMMPIVSDLAEDKEVTNTLTNTGTPFALANADSESHPIIMSVDGDKLIVTSDGSPVSTGLGNVLPSLIGETTTGPFNTYYVAVNLSDGNNADDSGETRLSKVKGEIAYYIDANDWTKTLNGYAYDMSLYNIMLVIPPVYWYSELDSGSTDTGKLYISSSPDAFVSMGISADQLKDYAHTYTENGIVGHAPAIMIGAYTSLIEDSQMVSHPKGTVPFAQLSKTYSVWQSAINSANSTVSYGEYQVWNAYQWTLYKLMCYTLNGSMNSKSIVGVGNSQTNSESNTAYSVDEGSLSSFSGSTSGNSLLISNPWSLPNWLGNTEVSNLEIVAGNELGGIDSLSETTNVLSMSYTVPYSQSSNPEWITKINPNSELFGLPIETSTSQNVISEQVYFVSGTHKGVEVSGHWTDLEGAGVNYVFANAGESVSTARARMVYVVTDESYTPPIGADMPYAYVVSYNTNGTISDVQSIENGVSNSYMPIYDSESTTYSFNPYWDFERKIDIPSISESTKSVDLAVGSDSILQFYNSGNVVLQTATGTVDLGRVNDVTPTPVTVTVQNGVMSYTKADSTEGTANVILYRANEGDYVYGQNVKLLNDLSQGNVYVGQYQYGVTTANGTKDIGAIGTFTSQTETVGEGEDATEVTTVVPDVALFNTANVSTSTVTSSITQGQYYATINSISIATEFSDSDSVDYTVTGFYAPKTQTYVTIETGGGLAYDILLYLPILILISVISFIGYATLRPDSDFVRSLKSRF